MSTEHCSPVLFNPYTSRNFFSAQGVCYNSPRKLTKGRTWLIFDTRWGPFPETEKSPDPRVLLQAA